MSEAAAHPDNSDSMDIDQTSVQAATETATAPVDKGKGKARQQGEDEGDSDESDEDGDDVEEDELKIEDEDLHALDTTAILPPGSRRRTAGKVDYTSPEALAKAGLTGKGDAAHDDEEDEDFTHRDDEASGAEAMEH